MDFEKIKELIECLEASKIQKLIYKKGDFELHLEKPSQDFVPVRKETYFEPAPPEKAPVKSESAPGSFVTCPMVGTFYASSGPDQPQFVKVGDRVSEGSVVCIIEAMKVMNEVKAGMTGTIAEILVHNGEAVEYGTRLFRIDNS